jgi:hypothetical protein
MTSFMKNESSSIFPTNKSNPETALYSCWELRRLFTFICIPFRLVGNSNFPHWINEKLFISAVHDTESLSYLMTSFVKLFVRQVLLSCVGDGTGEEKWEGKWASMTPTQWMKAQNGRLYSKLSVFGRRQQQQRRGKKAGGCNGWARAHFFHFYVHMTS